MKLIKKFLLTKVAQTRVMPCFQVVLEEAKIKEAPKLECPSTPAPSVEDIEKRLKVIASPITIHYPHHNQSSQSIFPNRRQRIGESQWKPQLWRNWPKRKRKGKRWVLSKEKEKYKISPLSNLKLEIIRHLDTWTISWQTFDIFYSLLKNIRY